MPTPVIITGPHHRSRFQRQHCNWRHFRTRPRPCGCCSASPPGGHIITCTPRVPPHHRIYFYMYITNGSPLGLTCAVAALPRLLAPLTPFSIHPPRPPPACTDRVARCRTCADPDGTGPAAHPDRRAKGMLFRSCQRPRCYRLSIDVPARNLEFPARVLLYPRLGVLFIPSSRCIIYYLF